ncbi:permease [Mesobacillus campisalis]|uniref:Permease n=1 Tax=Mesobacillus campisalis TaxID=1408103 RepID=A0A0M2T4V7_9BACI|nr:AEC family transporter [Mesobacillus campisalis]KKK39840.1 permease [Mesobacillus campisalis]
MEHTLVFQSIMSIFIMILIGAILSRTFPFNEDTRRVFISLIVNVAMPCIILSSIFNVKMEENTFGIITAVFWISIFINLIGIFIGWLLAHNYYKGGNKTKEIALLSGIGNTGFIGIPLCAILLGPEGALFAAIFDAGVDFTIWTAGVLLLQQKKQFTYHSLKSMINVPTLSIIIGLVFAYFHVTPPIIIINLTNQLAALAAPVAMFYIGVLLMTLPSAKVQKLGSQALLPIGVKLIILPVVTVLAMHYVPLEIEVKQTIIIQSMMPTLTLASILFAKYAADEDFGAVTTILSTLIALFSIPIMIYLINIFYAI